MNQSRYTIQLDNDLDPTLLMEAIDWGIKSILRQLQEEAQRNKNFCSLDYTPAPGLQHHERILPKLVEIFGAVAELAPAGEHLKVDEDIAQLLVGFLLENRDHIICRLRDTDPVKAQKIEASFQKLMAQLPFNEQQLPRGGMAFSPVHPA